MVEGLINSTITALQTPANQSNGITAALADFVRLALPDEDDRQTLQNDPAGAETETLLREHLEDYLTGEPDRIEALEDILERQDGLLRR